MTWLALLVNCEQEESEPRGETQGEHPAEHSATISLIVLLIGWSWGQRHVHLNEAQLSPGRALQTSSPECLPMAALLL